MQKYQFTGHLSPLPPGINLPLQISGDVYLASDVEAMQAEAKAVIEQVRRVEGAVQQSIAADRDAAQARVAELEAQVATLARSNTRLRNKIDRLQGND